MVLGNNNFKMYEKNMKIFIMHGEEGNAEFESTNYWLPKISINFIPTFYCSELPSHIRLRRIE